MSLHLEAQHSLTASVPGHAEGQILCQSPSSTIQGYIVYLSKRSPDVYKVQKLYVGLLREVPPPNVVPTKWDEEVRSDLEKHIGQATSMLYKSMRDEEVITELVLCKAGRKCSPAMVVLEPGASCPDDPVALKPTPATRENSLDSSLLKNTSNTISFAIESRASSLKTDCGLKARFTVQSDGHTTEHFLTIGGLIVVGEFLFGLTSAHAIMSCFPENSQTGRDSNVESTSTDISDSDVDRGRGSDSEPEPALQSLVRTQHPIQPASGALLGANDLNEVNEGTWTELRLPNILAYIGRGTTSGNYSFCDSAPDMSDFNLVDLGSIKEVPNRFYDPDQQAYASVLDYVPTREQNSGEVWIVAQCGVAPMKRYLLNGDTSIILRGKIMRTKKIQMAFTGAPGLSGSWVVKNCKLLGIVYAAYDRTPYLHMLPVERVFHDITQFLGVSSVRVATGQDVQSVKHFAETGGLNDGDAAF
ncbi:hypothetical protein CC78DRAFT_601821 [Lojkania enalia]|uniref:Uncharacterized protein n=1 Tax=Lojkania enalia TaxID=147567 RepID=A0A9P4TQS1_9PLEO|nr:hypothetical protein CC78DRAFT_601821 [Didymosphaeria enalia]